MVAEYKTIDISKVKVGERGRKDMGDLKPLAASMADIGQLQPIILTPNLDLISGERRLRAAELLGWKQINCAIADNFDTTGRLLLAERDENTCRKNLNTVEMVIIGRRLEELLKPGARRRREQARSKSKQARDAGRANSSWSNLDQQENSGKKEHSESPVADEGAGRVDHQVAESVGVSHMTYRKAKDVVDAAKADPANQDIAEEMKNTGNVSGAHRKLKQRQTTKVNALLDGRGDPVPDHLRDVFGDPWLADAIGWVEAIMAKGGDQLKKIQTQLKGKSDAYGAFLRAGEAVNIIDVTLMRMRDLHTKLKDGKPFAGCPACQADRKGCTECRKQGWVPEWKFNELTTGAA